MFSDKVGLTAHSVVRDQDGTLFDITPLANEAWRTGMHFVVHDADEDTFFAMTKLGLDIHCPCSGDRVVPHIQASDSELGEDEE